MVSAFATPPKNSKITGTALESCPTTFPMAGKNGVIFLYNQFIKFQNINLFMKSKTPN